MDGLSIASTSIRMDKAGRYCLNDLHQAAGGEQRHRPKYWLENQQTQDLVAEIEKGGITPIASKQRIGTYVIKQLAIAYATWVSPAFYLRVINAYEASTHRTDDWRRQRHVAASSHKIQAAMLQTVRAAQGKETEPHHYMNEAKLINWVVTGKFAGRDRDQMTMAELDLVGRLEGLNIMLLGQGIPYEDRKQRLMDLAASHRALPGTAGQTGGMRLVTEIQRAPDTKKAHPKASPIASISRIDDTSTAAQRHRMLQALRFGPVSTMYARRHLNIMMPGARIKELREAGHLIDTRLQAMTDDQGRKHPRVAIYTLRIASSTPEAA
ncbi:KilA-N domain-containing protein [Frateuria aurantia]|uniref:KilA-N domain-containing protein n=1 Tax=Frateuria aurantia (strain ATCC 33424 / DSM 6220 / KCTC 2777 / LMG 1558 / NBRC 3245 / NCIMB 13370) TaxID=767434 RepID=H8L1V9_FRAAD|nr:KilA-N domain-containing protein [Frateuria aurantia]AFC86370.1 KilA-N domain-containing protein [Frateuria aurantia DSM 6220]